ncbi:terpene synthase family protein [Kitasatospora sp. NPDC089913]|uniref:terpene synthase family protein n=1 Tax=Kitasatospora sp. NPDC089913 TaxID=3364080 RepID=UPI0037FADAA9
MAYRNLSRSDRQAAVEAQYRDVVARTPRGISLRGLLELSGMCPGFQPHAAMASSCATVEAWARLHGIWTGERGGVHLDQLGPASVTMNAFLLRFAIDERRLTLAGKAFHLLYYLDDVLGGEHHKWLSPAERARSAAIVTGVAAVLEGRPPQTGIERAAAEIMEELARSTPSDFPARFTANMRPHIIENTTDQDTATGHAPDVDTYFLRRSVSSGMVPAVLLVDYALDDHLTDADLHTAGVQADIERLRFLCVALACASNDFFSFEKEVLDAQDDYNLITQAMLSPPPHDDDTTPGTELETAIERCAALTNAYTREFLELTLQVSRATSDTVLAPRIHRYLDALTDVTASSWHWQIYTHRYQRPDSLWQETRPPT